MAQNVPQNRLNDGGIGFIGGVNSFLHPSLLPENQISWGINVVTKGGEILPRPPYSSVFDLGKFRAQGICSFVPSNGNPNIVFAVSGKIYTSEYPFVEFNQLTNISFDPDVDHIVFKEALKSNDVSVAPSSVLLMQDSRHRAAYWDGSTNRHLDPSAPSLETPIGLWMEFVGGRLWVSNGVELFASDIQNPLSFTENTYISAGGSFQAVDGKVITGLVRTADARSLLVFTEINTTILQAGITQRSAWPTTQNFISILFPGVGCVGGKSIVSLNGELWWFSQEGARSFTQVGSAIQTSRNAISSNEMKRSFDNLSPFLSRCCGFSHNTYLGFSVPSGDQYNRHTWVLDESVADLLGSDSSPCWQGVWMGTRPVEWTNVSVNGHDLCYFISQDIDGHARIYQAFSSSEEQSMFHSVETAGMKFDSPISFKTFLFSEIHLNKIFGSVHLTGEYRGDYGCWKPMLDVNYCADRCIEKPKCTLNFGFPQSQSRYVRTQNVSAECGSDFGSRYNQNVGTYFQNRFRWTGEAGIRAFKSHANQFEEKNVGECAISDSSCLNNDCCDQEVDYVTNT